MTGKMKSKGQMSGEESSWLVPVGVGKEIVPLEMLKTSVKKTTVSEKKSV